MTEEPDFKGYIHDVGGPTANFRHPGLRKAADKPEPVPERQCLFPKPCRNLKADHKDYICTAAKAPGTPKGEKGVYPLRHPV